MKIKTEEDKITYIAYRDQCMAVASMITLLELDAVYEAMRDARSQLDMVMITDPTLYKNKAHLLNEEYEVVKALMAARDRIKEIGISNGE